MYVQARLVVPEPLVWKKVPKVLLPRVFSFWESKFVFQYLVVNYGNFGVYFNVFNHIKLIAIILKI